MWQSKTKIDIKAKARLKVKQPSASGQDGVTGSRSTHFCPKQLKKLDRILETNVFQALDVTQHPDP